MAAGLSHCAVLTSSGELLTWGWNSAGQLGLGASSSGMTVESPQRVNDLPSYSIQQIAAGRVHTMFSTGKKSLQQIEPQWSLLMLDKFSPMQCILELEKSAVLPNAARICLVNPSMMLASDIRKHPFRLIYAFCYAIFQQQICAHHRCLHMSD